MNKLNNRWRGVKDEGSRRFPIKKVSFWIVFLLAITIAFGSGIFFMQRVAYALLSLIALGYLFSWWSLRKIRGEVEILTPQPQAGHYMEEKVTAWNMDWIPRLFLEIGHRTDLPGHHNNRLVSLLPRQSFTWVYRHLCQRRGLYKIGSLEIISADPLGLFSKSIRIEQEKEVLVYPATLDLPDFTLPWGRSAGEGYEKGRFQLSSPAISGVREYAPGDSLSHIHWPSTARLNRLMSKVFDKEPSGPAGEVWIIVDLNESAQAGDGSESTAEYGITIAASLAKKYLDTNLNAGLLIWGGKARVLSPQPGNPQIVRMLEALALARVQGDAPLVQISSKLEGSFMSNSIMILITPSNKEEIASLAIRMAEHRAKMVVILLDGSSFGSRANPADSLKWLSSRGIDAYTVGKGAEINKALDSKLRNWSYKHRHELIGISHGNS